MAFGIKRSELNDWKKRVSQGEIAFLTHWWQDKRFPGVKSFTKVGCADREKLIEWGRQYGLQPEWMDLKHEDFPHFDLFGDNQYHILRAEGLEATFERFDITLSEGETKMTTHTLINDKASIKVATLGAELQSFVLKETGIEYLWQADPAYWGRHSPVLFPNVGRLKEDCFYFEGERYEQPQHGFARDSEFTLLTSSPTHLLFELTESEKTLKNYPFRFKLHVGYYLDGATLKVEWTVENPADTDLYFSIGGHPAFNIPLEAGKKLADYRLAFDAPYTGELLGLKGPYLEASERHKLTETPQQFITLDKSLFEKDALIFDDLKTIKLEDQLGRHGVCVNTAEMAFVGVWSPTDAAPFVCIEPWQGIADTVDTTQEWTEKFASHQLAPQQIYKTAYEITLY